jgi:hypothetical protein
MRALLVIRAHIREPRELRKGCGNAEMADVEASPRNYELAAMLRAQRSPAVAGSFRGTHSPFAALQRFGPLSEDLLPCRQRRQQANS